MNQDRRTLMWVLGGVAVVFVCLCLAFSAALATGFGLTAIRSGGSADVAPATPLARAEPAVPAVPSPTAEPSLAAPQAAPTMPATSEPVERATPGVDLAEVDLGVLDEAWDFIASSYDGALPTPEELHDNTVRCSVEIGLGEEGYAAWEPRLDPLLAEQNTKTSRLDSFNASVYQQVWAEIQAEYDGELPTAEELRELTISCSVASSLDDEFSRYTPPAVAARMREDITGSFQGIGAFVRMNEDGQILEIVRPMDGQPADLVGLQAGDQVIAVDGENMIGRTIDEIISRIRGPRGSVVVLTIRRSELEQPFDVTITRAQIEIPLVESELLEQDIAYVRLSQFSANATAQVTDILEQLLPQAPSGLILDLRDNPGGLLSESISIADLFLDGGVVVRERNRAGLDEVFTAGSGELAESVPLVVLVNAGSASASEIVSGAVQDLERGEIIGETTFGKGSVQLPHELSDGGELRVTIARWYTPNDSSIDGQGIVPDIEVATPEDLFGPDDGQLNRAIDYLLNGQ